MMLRTAQCPCFSSHWQTWCLQKQQSNQCCKFTYRNEGGSFNASFSVANGISISEQRRDNEIRRFLSFLSHGWNITSASEVQWKLTPMPSLPYCWATALHLPEQHTWHTRGGPTCGKGGVWDVLHCKQHLQQPANLTYKSPSSLHIEFRSV